VTASTRKEISWLVAAIAGMAVFVIAISVMSSSSKDDEEDDDDTGEELVEPVDASQARESVPGQARESDPGEPSTTAPPPPPTAPTTAADSLPPGTLPDVAAEVAFGAWIDDAGRIPESTAWEPSGNFRTRCEFSHLAYDDPIVYPGEPGTSHLHVFFGNTDADAHSTYESLRSTGESTCQGGPLNRTGYWVPAVHDASGQVVVPDYFQLYYKGNGTQDMIRAIQTNPNGLRMLAGFDMDDMDGGSANPDVPEPEWSCLGGPRSPTIPDCADGQQVQVAVRFPMCWNGRDVDSPDHRSHMAYGTGGDGWITAEGGCPASHPVHLPELTLFAVYTSAGDSGSWYLSSDRMPGMTHANGSTFHADWFGAWDNDIQETWTQKCIREMLTCVYGEIGDGTLLEHAPPYDGPRRIDPPSP
jgi:hypothetical protein